MSTEQLEPPVRAAAEPLADAAIDGLDFNILIVDDDDDIRRLLRRILVRHGATVTCLADGLQALNTVREERIDIAIVDWRLPHIDGIELLALMKASYPDVEVLVMTGSATVDAAVRALKAGAYDFLTKPFGSIEVVLASVRRANERRLLRTKNRELVSALAEQSTFAGLIGKAPVMLRVFDLIQSVSRWAATVLITGESGTGKELVARAIHSQSPRSMGPFVALNCAAVPETLLEAELFGHVKGAFTGASATRDGLFQAAHGGTLFLDEIGDLPVALQTKLLRVLQESEVRKIGSNTPTRVDVRLVAATNVDLAKARTEGRFREDLYYRLDVVSIRLPALRERREDIPLLAHHFLRKHSARTQKEVRSLTPAAMVLLTSDEWRGNVRQLENVIERAVILCRGDTIDSEDLSGLQKDTSYDPAALPASVGEMPLAEARKAAAESFDRRYLEMRLTRAKGNVSEAARAADMDRANFRRLLKRYGLEPKLFGGDDDT